MRKTSFILVVLAVSLVLSVQIFGQIQRDIAVSGHNLNHQNNLALEAPNTTFGGWAGGPNATFQIFTTNPPLSWLKNKITGATLVGCTTTLNIINVPSVIDFNIFGGAELLFNGQGNFNVVCGATTLTGTFNQAILHVSNGSNSASVTLRGNSVNYILPTNLITNAIGNFAFANGSLSIGIITRDPVGVSQLNNTISGFRGYSNITFGAVKL
jgi:hypothetical protein